MPAYGLLFCVCVHNDNDAERSYSSIRTMGA